MERHNHRLRRNGLTALVAIASMGTPAVWLITVGVDTQLMVIGLGSMLGLLTMVTIVSAHSTRQALCRQAEILDHLVVPLQLAPESGLFERYRRFSEAMTGLADLIDPLQRELALCKFDRLCTEIEELAQGTIVFHGTETWRAAYGDLLTNLAIKSYYSVSWVRSGDYWNDPPGRHSMRLNYELLERGFRIERILILAEELWPYDEPQPAPAIRPWIDEQLLRGIVVRLVRESDLADEPELLTDFGIYGDRAVGIQELDELARTVRFLLRFDDRSRQQAHERWRRLQLFAIPCTGLLDAAKAQH